MPLRDKDNRVLELIGFTMNSLSAEELRVIRLNSQGDLEAIFFPKRIYTIEKFPVSISGKLDRKKLVFLISISLPL